MTDRGCVSLIAVGSMRVHEGCMGDDFVYTDQYCSCSINIAYRFISGSLRMPCVRSLLLCRLFCSIPSCVVVRMYRGKAADSAVFPLLLSFVDGVDIYGPMRSVGLCSLRIALFRFDIPLFRAPVRIFHILLFSCIRSLYARIFGN